MTGCVLIASDDPQVHQPLRMSLDPLGFEVHVAGSVDQAEACLDGATVGLVLLDAQWPNALALTRQWRERSEVGIILVGGDEAGWMQHGVISMGAEAVHLPDQESALELLHKVLRPGDVVLVKASRGVELQQLAAALL